MQYVYGPVLSRRLGQSLGVDPVPFKTCNWNCVYCQLGRTSPPVAERQYFVPVDDVVADVARVLQQPTPPAIDWITFAGSGEPTLHAGLGQILRDLKALTPLPIAVITNGSLLYRADVRDELRVADAVMPSVDAGSERLYRQITRPVQSLDFDEFIAGIVAFREQYRGQLWVEVMLVQGLNDSAAALRDLAQVLRRIRPDAIHLNSPVRPPCEPWVQPVDEAGLARAQELLGTAATVVSPAAGRYQLAAGDDILEAILAAIARHPTREQELIEALRPRDLAEIEEALADLARSGRAQLVERDGHRFWSGAEARYVAERLARCQNRSPPERTRAAPPSP
ncbi:MAG: radical SAM protein [Pirellulaceae bacterium]